MKFKVYIFDWGNTLMEDFPEYPGKMKDWPVVKLIPGAYETLEKISRNAEIFLATNAKDSKEEDIEAALSKAGIHKFINRIFCYRNMKIPKTDPDFFSQIIADTEYEKNEIIMTGDSFESDILTANKAGLHGIWFNTKTSEVKKGTMFHTVFSLKDII